MYLLSDLVSPVCTLHGCREAGELDVYALPGPGCSIRRGEREIMNEEDPKDRQARAIIVEWIGTLCTLCCVKRLNSRAPRIYEYQAPASVRRLSPILMPGN